MIQTSYLMNDKLSKIGALSHFSPPPYIYLCSYKDTKYRPYQDAKYQMYYVLKPC